jgi:5'-3' exonuclease
MVDVEADDALGAAAAVAAADDRVQRVLICTPDKDLAQCVVGDRVVQLDRRREELRDADAVLEKYGVPPESIPDWLALVGDSADGFPGLPGWGAKSAAAVLRVYGHLEAIPDAPGRWDVPGLRGAAKLAGTLADRRDEAELFRVLATLVIDVQVGTVDEWRWSGPGGDLESWCERLDAPDVLRTVGRLQAR